MMTEESIRKFREVSDRLIKFQEEATAKRQPQVDKLKEEIRKLQNEALLEALTRFHREYIVERK